MSASFPLAPAKRSLLLRRGLSLTGLGAVLFVGSLVAMRLRPVPWLFGLGAAGAMLFVLGMRRTLVGARPLRVSESAVWFGLRGVTFAQVDAVEVRGETLVVIRRDQSRIEEQLGAPAAAASEIARRAGLRPPKKGAPQRWERRSSEMAATGEEAS